MDDLQAARTPVGFLDALTEHLESIAERDIDRFAATISDDDDVRLIGAGGEITIGRENAVAAHREWFMSDGWSFSPEVVWTRENAESGWALARVTYRQGDDRSIFWLLLLFVAEAGTWRLIYDQATPIR